MITFTPNCTFPTASLGFIQAPPIRSTMEIVWSCLSIIVLCTWSILHLNVPAQHRPKGRRQKLMWKFALFRKKLKWMVITILAPELLLFFVINKFMNVRSKTPKLQALADNDGVPWSTTHSWFANQGGFHLYFPPQLYNSLGGGATTNLQPDGVESVSELTETNPINPQPDGDQPGIELAETSPMNPKQDDVESAKEPAKTDPMEEFALAVPENHTTPKLNERRGQYLRRRKRAIHRYGTLPGVPCKSFCAYIHEEASRLDNKKSDSHVAVWLYHTIDTWAVESWQLLSLRDSGIIKKLPRLEQEELEDRSKSDAVVKLIAIIQMCWMLTQLVVRAARGLPCTSLEISVVAFAANSLVTYLIQWSSIKDPAVPVRLEASRLPTKGEFSKFIKDLNDAFIFRSSSYDSPRFSNAFSHQSENDFQDLFCLACFAVAGLLFGAIHLVAWNFVFPTPLEQTLWRASALTILIAPAAEIMLMIVFYYIQDFNGWLMSIIFIISFITSCLLPVAYVVGRLFLLTESFRSLYFLPPAAYQATWTKNVPHFA